jgi:hypothetical protein
MPSNTRHIAEHIDRPVAPVYAYASDPRNIPEWAPGLGTAVEQVGDQWFVTTPDGARIEMIPTPANVYGVLDHDVVLPGDAGRLHNPMRVIVDGDGSEVVFAHRRQPGMTDEEYEADVAAVAADLARLKRIMEAA